MARKNGVWFVILVVAALMFLRLPHMIARQDSVLNTYGVLVEVDALARKHFVEPLDQDRLVQGAVRGLLDTLDPYSTYIAPEEMADFELMKTGEYNGLGIEIGVRDGAITIISPIEGSPAALAGIRPGDRMVEIDGHDVRDASVPYAGKLLDGTPNTPVTLTVVRDSQPDPIRIEIVRGAVSVTTVRGFRKHADGTWDYLAQPDGGIGYIRVSSFTDRTMSDFNVALERLVEQRATALVVDLRFNPGGMMGQAIEMVDRFISRGTIVSTVTRREAVHLYSASQTGTITDMALAVLINGGSASCSEIVSGSLQDHRRAVVVGERSFGKGSLQHVIPLTGDRGAVKLTVAHYRLPGGRIIHRTEGNSAGDDWGVMPDVEVLLTGEETARIMRSRSAVDSLVELDQSPSGALAGRTRPHDHNSGAPPSAHIRSDGTTPQAGSSRAEIVRDRQLAQALSLLAEQVR